MPTAKIWAVDLYPGTTLQSVVDANPPGTVFNLKAGVFREQKILPKSGDSFIGEPGTVLSGARLLKVFTHQGATWTANVSMTPGQAYGECDATHPACIFPEDLFIDNVPLWRVDVASSVAPGKWYFDYAGNTIYFQLASSADNPSMHVVEISVTRAAFDATQVSTTTGITIENMTIEKYASPTQMGAIGDQYPGAGWIVKNNEIRWNHGRGLNLGDNGQAIGNFIHDNGEMGMSGKGSGLIEGNEVSGNNFAGYDCGWECGGIKSSVVNGLTVSHNYVHDNYGPAMWTDINSINVVYDGNVIVHNLDGISHEIGYAAKIINNVVKDNGRGATTWLWNPQILLQNSQDVEVASNTIIVPMGANAIGLIEQNRGTGAYGAWLTINNRVHDNDVTYEVTNNGRTGVVEDDGSTAVYTTNTFDYDHYHAPAVASYWTWSGGSKSWSEFHALGQELHGTFDAVMPTAPHPTVELLTPADNSQVQPPGLLSIHASVTDSGSTINQVDFFENGLPIGIALTPPYALTWTANVTGSYVLTARAIDNQGTITTSVPIHVNVSTSAAPAPVTAGAPALPVRVYPNPFNASRGHQTITFDQLAPGSTLKIFTVSGHLVKTLDVPSGSISWPVTNSSGDKVASGLYFYLVTDPQDHQTRGKFAVIR